MNRIEKTERKINYLRISITDRCNLRCVYCMPEKIPSVPHEEILRYEEIIGIAEAAAKEGIRHIRLTGGEPLVRKDCAALVGGLKKIPGIETVSLTTNGILLSDQIGELKKAGLDGVNISLDTTDGEHFKRITGTDGKDTVLKAIGDSFDAGLMTKINVAVMEDTKPEEILSLVKLSENRSIHVRFIEMMPIGCGARFKTVDNDQILSVIREKYPDIRPEEKDAVTDRLKCGYGPARYYRIPGFPGSTGFISAVHHKFCGDCNRLRLTSTGFLKYCLCFDNGEDLRKIIRSDLPAEEIKKRLGEAFRNAAVHKPEGHCFDSPEKISEKKPMVDIGG